MQEIDIPVIKDSVIRCGMCPKFKSDGPNVRSISRQGQPGQCGEIFTGLGRVYSETDPLQAMIEHFRIDTKYSPDRVDRLRQRVASLCCPPEDIPQLPERVLP